MWKLGDFELWCWRRLFESPLDCKEIQAVHPKGNQSWIFFGRTHAEAETPNTLATWCKELTHWKRPCCWERLKAGGEGDDKGWDGWMASPTQWTWVWVNSRTWWWTGRPGVLRFMGSQRVTHDWETELNWLNVKIYESQVSQVLPEVTCSGAQPCSFVYRLSTAASSWQPQSWGVVAEAVRSFPVTQHCLCALHISDEGLTQQCWLPRVLLCRDAVFIYQCISLMSEQGERRKVGCEWCALEARCTREAYFVTDKTAKHRVYYMMTE